MHGGFTSRLFCQKKRKDEERGGEVRKDPRRERERRRWKEESRKEGKRKVGEEKAGEGGRVVEERKEKVYARHSALTCFSVGYDAVHRDYCIVLTL